MDKKDHIPMPTPMERRAAIRRIAEEGLADTAPSWRSLPLSALVFGVEDCLFMAVLLGLLPLALLPLPAGLLAEKLSLTLFLSAPLLYAAAQDGRQPARNVVPGALAALVGWMVVSAAFSFYVENFANYTAIYGALGTVIVLMMWLNLTALMLIMGAEINGVLISIRGRRTPRAGRLRRDAGK